MRMFVRLSGGLMATALLFSGAAHAAPAGAQTLERVVIVMRHGVRPPTKAKPLPEGYTDQAWPAWSVPAGYLTPHGEQAVAKLAEFDGKTYASLTGQGCPKPGEVRIVADTDQRTLKTASTYAETLFKGCAVPVENAGDGQADARFSPYEVTPVPDAALALKAAQDALPAGGLSGLDAANRARLARLDAILGCCKPPVCKAAKPCGLVDQPLTMDAPKGRVKITGGIDTGSTAAQILLLEYADGKPMSEVGWGKVSREDITDLSNLHALEFRLVARPKLIADFGARPLLAEVRAALFGAGAARYTLLVGHDSNLAYIGGALGLHWQATGFAADDPSPGGALVFELWSGSDGKKTVKIRYRSQALDEIRNLSPLPDADSLPMMIGACGGIEACDAGNFSSLLP